MVVKALQSVCWKALSWKRKKKAEGLKKITISPRVKGDLIMIGNGGFSPLTGFMTKADWKGVCESFLTADGTFWPVPVTLDVSSDDAAAIRRR
jgi:sulfate adenylyltransferase